MICHKKNVISHVIVKFEKNVIASGMGNEGRGAFAFGGRGCQALPRSGLRPLLGSAMSAISSDV